MIKKTLNSDLKILICEDEETFRQFLNHGLKKLGHFDVKQAENGKQGLDMIREAHAAKKPFDFIFSDLKMPELDGMELLKICKSENLISRSGFVIISAVNDSKSVVEAVKLGADDYYVKPMKLDDLCNRIQNSLFLLTQKLEKMPA